MNGIYIGTMGLMNNLNKVDTHANNIANVNTPGFKFEELVTKVFSHQQKYRNDDSGRNFIGDYNNKVTFHGKHINLKEGTVDVTNKDWDFFIKDNEPENEVSFFVIGQGDERFLTRNGQFSVDANRNLVTLHGGYVLNENNEPITIPENVELNKDSLGNIVNLENDELIDTIQIKTLNLEQRFNLEKNKDSLFYLNDLNIEDLEDFQGELKPHMYERSNVNLTDEMVSLLETQRRVAASQNIISSFNEIYQKEANDLLK